MDVGLSEVERIRHAVWPPEGFLLFWLHQPIPNIGIGAVGILKRKPEFPKEST